MAQKQVSKKNPALFLLALLKNGNATMRLEAGRLEIGPVDLAKRLAPKIQEYKADLVRLLLAKDCPSCGDSARIDSTARLEAGKWLLGLNCVTCEYKTIHEMPDFPVYNKSGKEI